MLPSLVIIFFSKTKLEILGSAYISVPSVPSIIEDWVPIVPSRVEDWVPGSLVPMTSSVNSTIDVPANCASSVSIPNN